MFRKLSQTTRNNDVFTHSYQRIGTDYVPRETVVYDINQLDRIDESELTARLFGEDDFVIPPAVTGREKVKAKIGKLYLEFQPGGKDSFELTIKLIDRHNNQLSTFLNLNVPRFTPIKFEHLLPISLSAYDPCRTIIGNNGPENQLSHAYELKLILTKLLLDQDINERDRLKFTEHYRALYLNPRSLAQPRARQAVADRFVKDVQHFGINSLDKPIDAFEVAAKIGAVHLMNLSINQAEIADILCEYLEVNNLTPDHLRQPDVKKKILGQKIDNGRYELKAIIEDVDTLYDQAIELPKVKNFNPGVAVPVVTEQQNETIAAFQSRIDRMISNEVITNLKSRKERYLELVALQVQNKPADFKKDLALSILNNPTHILKTERHFFRQEKYSNQTLSVHKLVASLLKDQVELVNNKVEIDGHTLSRHADKCFGPR
ncbi:hypothetical protein ACFORL_02605 [Legionella dresdenensis]|uniref:Uncharacterized protein n=1 Tax=Legionella dresdenensis TaxID=450200 RepID=A0ABV8CDE4_9GAMM